MQKSRLMMEKRKMWCRIQCTSKFIKSSISDQRSQEVNYDSLFLLHTATFAKRYLRLLCPLGFGESFFFGLEHLLSSTSTVGWTSLCVCSSSVFGVVLIIVDFVLVIVDFSLANKSRDVGDALEAVSLTISFFFLADVLLRVYVEGWVCRF